ncbi:MAG: hypothetical protein HDS73_07250 [Bacteroidales bacterium]|nr:hypothetical protein [Bacteroidales bacterium]
MLRKKYPAEGGQLMRMPAANVCLLKFSLNSRAKSFLLHNLIAEAYKVEKIIVILRLISGG